MDTLSSSPGEPQELTSDFKSALISLSSGVLDALDSITRVQRILLTTDRIPQALGASIDERRDLMFQSASRIADFLTQCKEFCNGPIELHQYYDSTSSDAQFASISRLNNGCGRLIKKAEVLAVESERIKKEWERDATEIVKYDDELQASQKRVIHTPGLYDQEQEQEQGSSRSSSFVRRYAGQSVFPYRMDPAWSTFPNSTTDQHRARKGGAGDRVLRDALGMKTPPHKDKSLPNDPSEEPSSSSNTNTHLALQETTLSLSHIRQSLLSIISFLSDQRSHVFQPLEDRAGIDSLGAAGLATTWGEYKEKLGEVLDALKRAGVNVRNGGEESSLLSRASWIPMAIGVAPAVPRPFTTRSSWGPNVYRDTMGFERRDEEDGLPLFWMMIVSLALVVLSTRYLSGKAMIIDYDSY